MHGGRASRGTWGIALAALALVATFPGAARAQITASHLTHGAQNNATTYNTASISPAPNRLVLAWILSRDNTGPGTPILSGNGLTWVQVATIGFRNIGSPSRHLTLFRAMGSSPTAGPLTITFAGNQVECAWSVQQFAGVDTTGLHGAGAIGQLATNARDAGPLAFGVTLPSPIGSTNATVGGFGNAVAPPSITPGAGYTGFPETGQTNVSLLSEWRMPGTTNVNVSDLGGAIAGIAFELKRRPAEIRVTPTSGLATTEAGGTATFEVVLYREPTANVTIGLSSSDPTEGSVPASVTFTPGNWNSPQTVTVTGVDDFLDDGSIGYTIVTASATSADPDYDGLASPDVSVTNHDDDTVGISVSPTNGLVTNEAGDTASFLVVLESQPTANVTIGLSSSDGTEGTVGPASLTFTGVNWNVPQLVTLTGVDDFLDDGDLAYTAITAAATSTDPLYSGMASADVSATNEDDDGAGITVTPVNGLVTTEAGGIATFDIVLQSEPTADVTIALSSSDPTEGAVAPASVTFTAANWNVAQTVTAAGVDDFVDDGDTGYTVVTAAAASTDPNYGGRASDDVSATNTDDDSAGITANPTSGLFTTEAGGASGFTIVLDTEPTADVTIGLSSSDPTEGAVAPASVTFTSANWNTPQAVTVTGVDDSMDDGDVAYTLLTAAATSIDPSYDGRDAADVSATNTDDDTAGISVAPVAGLFTTEGGGTATFTVVLDTEPAADVAIGLSSSDVTEGTISPASLTFTAADWNVPQTVTVTGVDDWVDDGDVAYTLLTAAATSSDPDYDGRDAADLSATNTDDDAAGISVAPVAGLFTTEGGGTATFTVALDTEPAANVTIGLSSSDVSEGTVFPASLTFTAANWNEPQTVTATGVNDLLDDGDIAYTVLSAAATSSDLDYDGRDAADVVVTNRDDDAAGISVTPVAGLVTTEAGGTATFTVVLDTEPAANVTIGLSSSDLTEGTIVPASLTFTVADWNVPRTVTVTGVDDWVDDGDVPYTILTAAAISTDPGYGGRDGADVSATNANDDAAGITVTPVAGLVTTEAGGTATFTVVLDTEPTADVTIGLTSSDVGEGTVAPASLTFTAADWNVPQTATVTGIDDFVDDGDIAYTLLTVAASSADPRYDGRDAADVSATNTDGDAAGITVGPVAGLVTTEGGGSASFTIVLQSQPIADVTIGVSSGDPTEGSAAPASLVFTAANWNAPQSVTVTGVNDAVDDGDIAYSILTTATSSDPGYDGRDLADVSVMNTDDDAAGITVAPVAGLVTTEGGGSGSFTVVLQSQPTADVTISVASADPTEGSAAPASLVFTAANWDAPQTVTVTGVNDPVDDGDVAYSIVTAAAVSADPLYGGQDPADISATNTDDDAAAITVAPVAGLVTTEGGGAATFTIVLQSQPTADVTIGVSSSDPTEGAVAPASLVFTAASWSAPQTVTVTGVDDLLLDGDVAYTVVTTPAVSADPLYGGRNPADVACLNVNDDLPADALTSTVTAVPSLVIADGVATSVLTATLLDANGAPVAGQTVVFTSNRGGYDVLTQPANPTDASGVAVGAIRSTTPGIATVTASIPASGVTLAAQPSVTFTNGIALQLTKTASREQATIGEPITYTITLANLTTRPLTGVTVEDRLPAPFRFTKETATLDGQALGSLSSGTELSFDIGTVPALVDGNGNGVADPGEPGFLTLRYRAVVGTGATAGSHTNVAYARDACLTCVVSNTAEARVEVVNDPVLSMGTVLGRVFEDTDRNGIQGRNEPGLGGARVALDDGTVAITDREGLYHLAAVAPGHRLVKMDVASLPGLALATGPESRFLTVTSGTLAKANFGVVFDRDTVNVGSPGVPGLEISASAPIDSIDVRGNLFDGSVLVNGRLVVLQRIDAVARNHDALSPAVVVNDSLVPFGADGRFFRRLPGSSTGSVFVSITDPHGRTSQRQFGLPALEILGPTGTLRLTQAAVRDGYRVREVLGPGSSGRAIAGGEEGGGGADVLATARIVGRTSPGNTVEVEGDRLPVAADGTFQSEVDLRDGLNAFAVVVRNPEGLARLVTVPVRVAGHEADGGAILLDPIPNLRLVLPPMGRVLPSGSFAVSGTTDPGNRVTVNGQPLDVAADGSFSGAVKLPAGTSKVVIEAIDPAGRTARVEREATVSPNRLFLVAIADGAAGTLSGTGMLRDAARSGDQSLYTEGRVAYYLKGVVRGKYLVTSAYDSGIDELAPFFDGVDAIANDRLLANLDPNRYYPVYGDSSTTEFDAQRRGRFYLGLEGEEIAATVGAAALSLEGGELGRFQRTVDGARLRYQSLSRTRFGDSGTQVTVIGAEARLSHVRDELRATGGSLYYLSHRNLVEGGEQVSLAVVDRRSGLVRQRVPQRRGADYTIGYFEGRLLFTRPIASVTDAGGIVSMDPLSGDPVVVEVEYEARGVHEERTLAGGRARQQLGSHVALGGLLVRDDLRAQPYELRAVDGELRLSQRSRITMELANSTGAGARSYVSQDGGLSFVEQTPAGALEGTAWKAAFDLDAGDWMKRSGVARLRGYVKEVDREFASSGNLGDRGTRKAGLGAEVGLGPVGALSLRFDEERRPDSVATGAEAGASRFLAAQWRRDRERWGLGLEAQTRDVEDGLGHTVDSSSVMAARLWARLARPLTARVDQQYSLRGIQDDRTTLGLRYQLSSRLGLEAEGTTGSLGRSAQGRASYAWGAGTIYLAERFGEDASGTRATTVLGSQIPFGPSSRVYSEYQWQTFAGQRQDLVLLGGQKQMKPSSTLTVLVGGEHSQSDTRPVRTSRTSISTGATLATPSGIRLETRNELRFDTHLGSRVQALTSNQAEVRLLGSLTMLGRWRWSETRDRVLDRVEARLEEHAVGLAMRPVRGGPDVLARFSRVGDLRPTAGGLAPPASHLDVLAIEGATPIGGRMEWTTKSATRVFTERSDTASEIRTHSLLLVNRLNVGIVGPLGTSVEYRLLTQREARDRRSGWLQELTWDVAKHVRAGAGFCFADFTDNEFDRNDSSVRGGFVRLQGRY